MTNDDEAARRARADGLRQRIAAIKSGAKPREVAGDSETSQTAGDEEETAPLGESPREFVQRKMRELDRDPPPDSKP